MVVFSDVLAKNSSLCSVYPLQSLYWSGFSRETEPAGYVHVCAYKHLFQEIGLHSCGDWQAWNSQGRLEG